MILSQDLPQIENTTSLLSVVCAASAPAPTAATSSSILTTNNNASIPNMLGQEFIACSNCVGSLEQLLSKITAVSNAQKFTSPIPTSVANNNTTDTNPSVIDSILLLIQSSGKHLYFCFGQS